MNKVRAKKKEKASTNFNEKKRYCTRQKYQTKREISCTTIDMAYGKIRFLTES